MELRTMLGCTVVVSLLTSSLPVWADDGAVATTQEGCILVATSKKGSCRITSLSYDQAQAVLQKFADYDPLTLNRYSPLRSEARAGDVWSSSMSGLKRGHVCVAYNAKGSTVFSNCQ